MALEARGQTHSRIIPFFLVGALSSLVDIGLMYTCTTFFEVWYLYAAAFSYCCGIVVNYLANKYLTFHDTSTKTAVQFATFTAVSISCLIVNLGIVWLGVTFFALTPLLAKIIATCLAFLWSYHGQSRFTFRNAA
ncbi:GtrA family protein [Methanoregula boonei 6A8]|jgi:putative flippase GtrA|uniref:GtrA family protein n=2 Tax=Methanoregula TaxID=395331 RepID=A7I6A4_METB6|nr:GtrA family protein [Methanoregula boonei 6A8]